MTGRTSAIAIAATAAALILAVWAISWPTGPTHPDSPDEAASMQQRLAEEDQAAHGLHLLPFAIMLGSLGFAAAATTSVVVVGARKRAQMERGE